MNYSMGRGEFALVVADSWQRLGLGIQLMGYVFEISRDGWIDEITFLFRATITKLSSFQKRWASN